jgi:hypothetical protein
MSDEGAGKTLTFTREDWAEQFDPLLIITEYIPDCVAINDCSVDPSVHK